MTEDTKTFKDTIQSRAGDLRHIESIVAPLKNRSSNALEVWKYCNKSADLLEHFLNQQNDFLEKFTKNGPAWAIGWDSLNLIQAQAMAEQVAWAFDRIIQSLIEGIDLSSDLPRKWTREDMGDSFLHYFGVEIQEVTEHYTQRLTQEARTVKDSSSSYMQNRYEAAKVAALAEYIFNFRITRGDND